MSWRARPNDARTICAESCRGVTIQADYPTRKNSHIGNHNRGIRMRIWTAVLVSLAALTTQAVPGRAAALSRPQGIDLTASPALVDVGQQIVFTLTAKKWHGPVSVSLSFLSPHHGFTGTMPYRASCNCFVLGVILARRIHGLETGKAVAHVRQNGQTYPTARKFSIRGLAPNGKDFAPGGRVFFSTWVSDPHPSPHEYEHFCGWTKTQDGLGVAGNNIKFVAHFPKGKRVYTSGPTGSNGVACTSKNIGNLKAGSSIKVDASTGKMHATASFTSQS